MLLLPTTSSTSIENALQFMQTPIITIIHPPTVYHVLHTHHENHNNSLSNVH
ncbi:hypothetical protein Hanom_Chr04g00280421 [Helianthus anomalus]